MLWCPLGLLAQSLSNRQPQRPFFHGFVQIAVCEYCHSIAAIWVPCHGHDRRWCPPHKGSLAQYCQVACTSSLLLLVCLQVLVHGPPGSPEQACPVLFFIFVLFPSSVSFCSLPFWKTPCTTQTHPPAWYTQPPPLPLSVPRRFRKQP